MEYQAHIYWTDSNGYKLAMDMKKILISLGCKIGVVNDRVLPYNYDFTYHDRMKKVVERYLKNNHADLSIMIHEKDNTAALLDVRWIGTPIV